MDIVIKKVGPDELVSLSYVFDNYMVFYKKPSNRKKYQSYLKERIENSEAIVFMAFNKENEAIGFVLNYFSFSSVSQGKIVVLNDLFVNSQFRKNGVAEKLIRKSFDLAEKIGAVKVDLGTAKDTADNLLGEEGQGFHVMMKTLDFSRPGVAAQALGIALPWEA